MKSVNVTLSIFTWSFDSSVFHFHCYYLYDQNIASTFMNFEIKFQKHNGWPAQVPFWIMPVYALVFVHSGAEHWTYIYILAGSKTYTKPFSNLNMIFTYFSLALLIQIN